MISLRRAFQYILRNKGLSFVAVVVMASAFFVTSVFAVASYGSYRLLDYFESQAQVTGFFKDEATEADILSIKSSIEATGLVETATYVSKEEALNIYVNRFNEDPALLESIAANILPASLDIRAKDSEDLPQIAQLLKAEVLVEDVSFREDILEKLLKITKGAQLIQVILVILQLFSTTFMVLITIALVIQYRRDEIEIMRLVGATRRQVALPFILQAIFYGLLGALFSAAVIVPALPQVMPTFEITFLSAPLLEIVTPYLLVWVMVGNIVLGLSLGALGGFLATWRFLK